MWHQDKIRIQLPYSDSNFSSKNSSVSLTKSLRIARQELTRLSRFHPQMKLQMKSEKALMVRLQRVQMHPLVKMKTMRSIVVSCSASQVLSIWRDVRSPQVLLLKKQQRGRSVAELQVCLLLKESACQAHPKTMNLLSSCKKMDHMVTTMKLQRSRSFQSNWTRCSTRSSDPRYSLIRARLKLH